MVVSFSNKDEAPAIKKEVFRTVDLHKGAGANVSTTGKSLHSRRALARQFIISSELLLMRSQKDD